MPDTRRQLLIVCRSVAAARAAREAIANGDQLGATGPVSEAAITPMGFPYRDDFGNPITRHVFRVLTNKDAMELTRLAFDAAGGWLEVF